MLFGYSFLLQFIFGEVKLKLKRIFLFQLFVALFIILFCALGTWQLYRLQWKLELISEITFGLDSTPIRYSNSIKKNYQRVVTDGVYNFKNQIFLYSLNEKGKPGYDVITPFKTIDNEEVLDEQSDLKRNTSPDDLGEELIDNHKIEDEVIENNEPSEPSIDSNEEAKTSVRRLSLFDTLDNQEKMEVSENNEKMEPKIEENINDSIEIDEKNHDLDEKKEFSPEDPVIEEEFNQDAEDEELLDIPTFLRRQAN